jgi:hypothetical protein
MMLVLLEEHNFVSVDSIDVWVQRTDSAEGKGDILLIGNLSRGSALTLLQTVSCSNV